MVGRKTLSEYEHTNLEQKIGLTRYSLKSQPKQACDMLGANLLMSKRDKHVDSCTAKSACSRWPGDAPRRCDLHHGQRKDVEEQLHHGITALHGVIDTKGKTMV